MNFLAAYNGGDDDSSESSAHEAPVQVAEPAKPTAFVSVNPLFADLPPPQQAASAESAVRASGRIGARLRQQEMSNSSGEPSLVHKFATRLVDAAAVRERELRLAEQREADEAIEKELHGGASLAEKRSAAAALSDAAAATKGPLFSALLPPPKRSRALGVEEVLKPADVVDLPPPREAEPEATPAAAPVTAKPKLSYAQSLMAELETAYADESAAVYANPKFDPAHDYAATSDWNGEAAHDLPSSFTGRHAAPVEAMRAVSASTLLQKSSAESEMQAPKTGTEFTGFTPTLSGRRRGALTYAAHVALSNQTQLEEKWRLGSQAKRDARSRYGF